MTSLPRLTGTGPVFTLKVQCRGNPQDRVHWDSQSSHLGGSYAGMFGDLCAPWPKAVRGTQTEADWKRGLVLWPRPGAGLRSPCSSLLTFHFSPWLPCSELGGAAMGDLSSLCFLGTTPSPVTPIVPASRLALSSVTSQGWKGLSDHVILPRFYRWGNCTRTGGDVASNNNDSNLLL